MPVHDFVDESARTGRYFIAAAVVEPANVRRLRRTMRKLLLPGQRELHFQREKPIRLGRTAWVDWSGISLTIAPIGWSSIHVVLRTSNDERTLRRVLGPHPSASELVYDHVDSTTEPLLWIADAVAWCYGAGGDWRLRVKAITTTVIELD